ncbi:hypothetical protein [Candidatus Nesciobacter abundans]|uniref:Uncharacterized protein n=1 Tax=Candidatus Nesciobacter abundans TaxID=2601668 RepID=A0A5C0UGI1_9PROT|nr:hypothetical protein [Candidatus Nesciobacter abundans]QEK39226.1 hypothetical protein FZC36_02205 [Candidatus Nesciobacter abundans]
MYSYNLSANSYVCKKVQKGRPKKNITPLSNQVFKPNEASRCENLSTLEFIYRVGKINKEEYEAGLFYEKLARKSIYLTGGPCVANFSSCKLSEKSSSNIKTSDNVQSFEVKILKKWKKIKQILICESNAVEMTVFKVIVENKMRKELLSIGNKDIKLLKQGLSVIFDYWSKINHHG